MTTDLASLGWDETRAAHYARHRRPGHRPGRAAAVECGVATVLTAAGPVRASVGGRLLGEAAADRTALPATGDWLVLRRWPDRRTTIEVVLPRSTAVVLPDRGDGTDRLLAANADTVALVERMERGLDPRRIERLLEPVIWSGAAPVVVLTGAGRFDASTVAETGQRIAERVNGLIPGVPVCAVDLRTGAGLAALRPMVASGRTLALVGRPGANRSALVDALVGAPVLVPGRMPAHSGGRAHPRGRALVPVPGGGVVLDTPALPAPGVCMVTPEWLPGSA